MMRGLVALRAGVDGRWRSSNCPRRSGGLSESRAGGRALRSGRRSSADLCRVMDRPRAMGIGRVRCGVGSAGWALVRRLISLERWRGMVVGGTSSCRVLYVRGHLRRAVAEQPGNYTRSFASEHGALGCGAVASILGRLG